MKKFSGMEKNFSLRDINTFGFDVKARCFKEVRSLYDICELISDPEFISYRIASRILILSGGSNILFTNEFFDGFVVYPNLKGIEITDENDKTVMIRCYCGEVWKDFADYTVSRKLYGIENLSDIPGKVGAAPVQNIGAYGSEVKDVIYQVHTINLVNGETRIFKNEECEFSYRNSIFKKLKSILIYAVDFILKKHGQFNTDYGNISNYLINNNISSPTIQDVAMTVKAIRAEKLPEVGVVGSVGSFFQNAIVSEDKYLEIKKLYPDIPMYPMNIFPLPNVSQADIKTVKIPSGWLIDRAGWKGYRENHVGVWDKQALVLVHYGGGKPQEIIELMKKIQLSVKDKFGIDIKPEVNIV